MRTLKNKGHWPEYGAIFMANKSTREECFERNLFGLPYRYADFVMEVKIGMLLFLYDVDEKKLYGVFEAASNGGMNIIPDAYKSTSHMMFPAQVRFTTLWHCDPLRVHVFRDAIEANFYERSKFNFGLSKDQVSKLLNLFNRKIKIPSSPVEEKHDQKSNQMEKSVILPDSCSLEISDLIKESIYELQESILGKQELIPEIQDSIQDSNPEKEGKNDVFCELEQSSDYIPLPSIEPDEIEEVSDIFQWSDMSFKEVGECLKKPFIWPLENHTSPKKKVDIIPEFHVHSEISKGPTSSSKPKEINDSSGSEVQGGMYADISMTRTSAFLRLSGGVGKVVVEKSRRSCDSKVDNLEDILEGLERRWKKWDRKRKSRNVSKSEVSVFSRLGRYREGVERVESMYIHERSNGSQSYKRKTYEYDDFSWYEESNKSTYYSENYKNFRYCSSFVPDFSDDAICRL